MASELSKLQCPGGALKWFPVYTIFTSHYQQFIDTSDDLEHLEKETPQEMSKEIRNVCGE